MKRHDRLYRGALGTIATVGLVLGAVGLAAPAHGANADSGADWDTSLREFWTTYGVDSAVQDRLIKDAKHGDFPDSLEGGTVVSTTNYKAGDEVVAVQTFEDGSILVSTVEQPPVPQPGTVQPLGIENCSVQSYTGVTYYNGCKITGQSGLVGISFYTSYTISHNAADSISSTGWSPQCSIFPGTCTLPSITYWKQVETSTRAALQYSTQWTISGGGVSGSGVLNLSLRVQNNSATTYLFT